jgi:hypothetical protein
MADERLDRIQQAFDEWRAAEAAYQEQAAMYALVSRVDDQTPPKLAVEPITKRAEGQLSELRAAADAAQRRFEELSDEEYWRPWRLNRRTPS